MASGTIGLLAWTAFLLNLLSPVNFLWKLAEHNTVKKTEVLDPKVESDLQ